MKRVKIITFIEQRHVRCFGLFKVMTDREYALLVNSAVCSSHKKGSVVYKEACVNNGAYVVLSGVVKQYKLGTKEKQHIIRFAKRGDLIGFRSLITNNLACTTSEVIEDAVLLHFPGHLLFRLMKNNFQFYMFVLRHVCLEMKETNGLIMCVSQKRGRERLAHVLLQLKERFDVDRHNVLQLPLSRREIASLIGAAPESAIRLLSDFRSENIIDLQGRFIKLLDLPALARISNVSL